MHPETLADGPQGLAAGDDERAGPRQPMDEIGEGAGNAPGRRGAVEAGVWGPRDPRALPGEIMRTR